MFVFRFLTTNQCRKRNIHSTALKISENSAHISFCWIDNQVVFGVFPEILCVICTRFCTSNIEWIEIYAVDWSQCCFMRTHAKNAYNESSLFFWQRTFCFLARSLCYCHSHRTSANIRRNIPEEKPSNVVICTIVYVLLDSYMFSTYVVEHCTIMHSFLWRIFIRSLDLR